ERHADCASLVAITNNGKKHKDIAFAFMEVTQLSVSGDLFSLNTTYSTGGSLINRPFWHMVDCKEAGSSSLTVST
ncbi:hypothetical protein, partial [Klebsiella aerogenes]|uniref:hypothetical protein n=1 Tax=Klebsiella aerogenes TaxID=548 RepID=UPI001954B8E0